MIELLYNKWLWVVLGVAVIMLLYRFFSKDKNKEIIEREYHEILNSEEYKVKGRQ